MESPLLLLSFLSFKAFEGCARDLHTYTDTMWLGNTVRSMASRGSSIFCSVVGL